MTFYDQKLARCFYRSTNGGNNLSSFFFFKFSSWNRDKNKIWLTEFFQETKSIHFEERISLHLQNRITGNCKNSQKSNCHRKPRNYHENQFYFKYFKSANTYIDCLMSGCRWIHFVWSKVFEHLFVVNCFTQKSNGFSKKKTWKE